jgi:hypothetical protein
MKSKERFSRFDKFAVFQVGVEGMPKPLPA